ncbi:ribosome-binding protein aMBF1 (putative translation factor) [Labrenzia sp. EL_142]|nr:ribosome-binding protein aMBF1 (putative translation factor) [Labrenzia sp. EL_142]
MINPKQCRAARAWLGWSQDDLAEKAECARRTIAAFEQEKSVPFDRTLRDIQRTLEDAGITFLMDRAQGIGLQESQEKSASTPKTLSAK